MLDAQLPLKVAVVGCGLIGSRRARCAAEHPLSRCELVIDVRPEATEALAADLGCRWDTQWRTAVEDADIDVVVVSAVNKLLFPIAASALEAGKDVLVEKPMGRNLDEAERLAAIADKSGRRLKIGFNHRYHPALQEAYRRLRAGQIGEMKYIRAVYGHGGRPGYDKEWRGDKDLAGGGELLDQGAHLVDLIRWMVGEPILAIGKTVQYVWNVGDMEDNAFGLFTWEDGKIAQFHTSWTQWKNRFQFQLYGTLGALEVEGLGGSYGTETLTHYRRNLAGGAPEVETMTFEGPDESWLKEWHDFVTAIRTGGQFMGTPEEGVGVMRLIDGLYRSSRCGQEVSL